MNLHKHKKGEICLVKVEVKNLTKIFGKKTQVALEMMKNHQPKTDILKKPAQRSVFTMLALMFKKAKYSLSWVFPVVGNQP